MKAGVMSQNFCGMDAWEAVVPLPSPRSAASYHDVCPLVGTDACNEAVRVERKMVVGL